jgi:uncharacterized membrane protein YhhN
MLLLYGSMAVAVLHWIFTGRQSLQGIYLTKPVVLILLIGWVAKEGWAESDPGLFPLLWFVAALFFCLGGDIFLMLPDKWFRPGLALFLIGHLFYIRGFSQWFRLANVFPGIAIFLIILIPGGGWVVRRLFGESTVLQGEKLRIPILLYAGVISIMLLTAFSLLFDPRWPLELSGLIAFGAASFYLSDLMNAWHRFVKPIRFGGVWIMSSYHIAQIFIAAGVTMFLTR